MSDLQTDLNHWTDKLASAHGWDIDHDTMLAIIHVNEAARKYAKPDYEAAARTKYYNTVNRQVMWCEWDDLEDDEREELVANMRPYVAAALGVTEAPDGQ